MINQQPRLFWASFLSLLPGAAHLYLRQWKKAAGLLIISTGIILTLIFSSSIIMKLLMAIIYLATAGPSVLEAYQIARYGRNTIDTHAPWYVVMLLLTTGFSALPLLWQSRQFSRPAKIAWTITVPLLAILFFTTLARYWDLLESQLENLLFKGKT